MLKQLHKILFITCFALLFAFNFDAASAQNSSNVLSNATHEQMRLIRNDMKVNDLDIEPINTQEVKNVIPDTKKESKKVMGYFLRAMLAVILSGIILYLILVFVKKYYGSAFVNTEEEEYFESFDLTTPNSKQEALKTFLNKTK